MSILVLLNEEDTTSSDSGSGTGDGSFFDGLIRPRIQVLAGLGGTLDPGPTYLHLNTGPGLGTGLLGGPGAGVNETDITDTVRSISISQRGPTSDIDQADPVTCQIVVNNFDGAFDPQNPASPYATGTPLEPFSATATDTSPALNYTQAGGPSSSGCTNSAVYLTSHTNLITNPGFETDTSGWFPGASVTLARTTTQAETGVASGQLTKTTASGQITANTAAPDLGQGAGFDATAGQVYSYLAKFRAGTTGRTCRARIIFYNSGGTNIGDAFGGDVTDGTGGWTGASWALGTAPAGTTQAAVQVQIDSAANGEVHYFDSNDAHVGTDQNYVPAGTWPANGSLQDVGGAAKTTPNGTNPAVAALPYTFWQDLAAPAGGYGWRACRWQIRPEITPPSTAGYYFANQGLLEGVGGGEGNGWYAGLQSGSTFSGGAKIALFSIWNAIEAVAGDIAGTVAQPFGGEGVGYQIIAPYPWVAGRAYSLQCAAEPTRGSRWFAVHLRDNTTGTLNWLGSIRAASSDSGQLYGRSYQWSELYSQTSPATSCPLLPQATTWFSVPTFSAPTGTNTLADGTPFRVRWIWDGTAYDRFYGELSSIRHSVANDWDITATLICADGQEKLGRAYLPETLPTRDGDRTGTRISWLADQAAYPTALRAIDTGYTTLGLTTLGDSAAELMAKTASTEFGLLFVDGSGRVVFYDRHRGATTTQSTTTQATFGDPTGTIPLRDIDTDLDRARTFNRVAITREAAPSAPVIVGDVVFDDAPDEPVEQVADDVVSQSGPGGKGVLAFPAQVGQLLRNDYEALALAQYLVARYKTTTTRISELNVSTLSCPSSLYSTLLGLGPWDRVAVDQNYGPADITATLLIQSVTEEIVADPPSWSLSFTTSPPPPTPAFWLLGTGQLGTAKLTW